MKYAVLKIGGASLFEKSQIETIFSLIQQGYQPVIVHGGGKSISALSQALGHTPVFKNGLRVTDKDNISIIQMALCKITSDLVHHLRNQGIKALGVSGLFQAKPSLGLVGEIEGVDISALEQLCCNGYIPITSSLAYDQQGDTYNVNADSAAAALAIALQAEKLFLLTDVPGVFLNPKDPQTQFLHLSSDVAKHLVVEEGMIPKLKAAVAAIEGKVLSVLIGNTLNNATRIIC